MGHGFSAGFPWDSETSLPLIPGPDQILAGVGTNQLNETALRAGSLMGMTKAFFFLIFVLQFLFFLFKLHVNGQYIGV